MTKQQESKSLVLSARKKMYLLPKSKLPVNEEIIKLAVKHGLAFEPIEQYEVPIKRKVCGKLWVEIYD